MEKICYSLLSKIRCRFRLRIQGERLEQLKKVYVGKGEEDIFYLYYGKMGCRLLAAVVICFFLIAAGNLFPKQNVLIKDYFLKKEGVTGQEKNVSLSATADDKEKEVTILIPEKHYTKKELKKKFREAEEYINQNYLGENTSAEQIDKPLNLVKAIPKSAVTVSWKLGTDGWIDEDGGLINDELEENCVTEITAVLAYGEEEKTIVKQLTILPPQKSEEEIFWEKWKKQLESNQNESMTKSYLKLPDSIDGIKISYQDKTVSVTHIILGITFFFPVVIILYQEEQIRKEIVHREKEMKMDYPEFVEQFVLLVGAGLTIQGAWKRIAGDYEERNKGKHYIYEEMLVSVREMESGMSEARAYELFGKRTGLLQYMKFCTLIVQNLKKGSADLLNLLNYEVEDAFRERKENAKALGEEAGTKLLFPMMLMLVVVFALILYAAFNNM